MFPNCGTEAESFGGVPQILCAEGGFSPKNKKEYFCGVCLKLENRDKVCDSFNICLGKGGV